MKRYNCDCHYFNGYTGCCYLKGGECGRVCKDWQSEDQYIESLAESDITLSVAQLREILKKRTDRLGSIHTSVDTLIKTVKQDLHKPL